MVKHILGVVFIQVVIIYAVAFGGDHFFPEPDAKWRFERANDNNFVYPGRLYDWDGSPLYILKEEEYGSSRHYTNVYNIFVMMQVFNMLNARKINDEKNIFQGIFANKIFIGVWILVVVIHVIIV